MSRVRERGETARYPGIPPLRAQNLADVPPNRRKWPDGDGSENDKSDNTAYSAWSRPLLVIWSWIS